MTPLVSLRAALDDAALLGTVMAGESREPMRALLLASQGEPLTSSELEHFRRLTQRESPPDKRVAEGHIFAGRRAGKSSGIAALATYLGGLCDYSDCLSRGERGVALIVAENQKQARVLLRYIEGAFDASPALSRLIIGRTQFSLSLSNNVDIEVRSSDFRALRGLTLVCFVGDEINFWRSEYSTNPDFEVIGSVRPALITTKGQLFTIGSPYAKRGFGYQTFRRHFGPAGNPRILVAHGGTRAFNPTVPQEEIDRAYAEDPASAASEWGAEWRSDIQGFVDRAIVDACVIPGRHELPRVSCVRYVAFIDAAGGSGGDSMTMAVAHRERIGDRDVAVLNLVREVRPPFSPDVVTAEFAGIIKGYGISRATADRWGADWVTEAFAKHGVRVEQCARPKSDLYRELLAPLNSGRIELLDHPRLVAQLCGLERRTARSGKDSVDHGQGAHDDLINSAAGALIEALGGGTRLITFSESMIRALELGLI
ncbi:hypothetical protein IYX23_05635 [Methylocystis sp. L43]|uniref:hypothetical protein n=1 Tax=unclassified Methylocystis TaxID=2625913 RepID=UPI0018C2D29F|nr:MULTISPECIES: hypothetical protein [unclassified Methylocystis]MBG0797168.1 hypothetical protein [Methylocystis sp. L43]MBG0804961.1 hypothetical protein [Methylocystis sp. H15]